MMREPVLSWRAVEVTLSTREAWAFRTVVIETLGIRSGLWAGAGIADTMGNNTSDIAHFLVMQAVTELSWEGFR